MSKHTLSASCAEPDAQQASQTLPAGATAATAEGDRATASTGSIDAWLARIHANLAARSPADVERVKRRAESMKRARHRYTQSSTMMYSNAMSSQAYAGGLRKCADVRRKTLPHTRRGLDNAAPLSIERDAGAADDQLDSSAAEAAYQQVSGDVSRQMKTLQTLSAEAATPMAMAEESCAARSPADATVMRETAAVLASELGFDDFASANLTPANTSPSFGGAVLSPYRHASREALQVGLRDAEAIAPVAMDEMDTLLQELRSEPDNDAERTAKFAIYETGSETVSKSRAMLMDFWSEASSDFDEHPQVRCAIEKELKDIDKAERMGINDDPYVWFVYSMAQKVAQNTQIQDRILRSIRTKLELLGTQTECPICFEEFGESDVATLGCAHMVCAECWAHWQKAQLDRYQQPFCPLCRQDDFVESIVQMNTPLPNAL